MHSKIAAFILKVVLLNSVLPNGYAQQQELTPPPSIQKICSQCHALEVRGTCLAGDCASSRVVRIAKPQPWDKVLDRMSSKGAHISDSQRREITSYLQAAFPAKLYPLAWKKVSAFEKGGWNVISLREYKGLLYAGFEGNGKIFRTADGINWREVASTKHYTVYGLTPYKNFLYAGAAEHDPQVWRSADGQHWQQIASLPVADTGIYSVGTFKNRLYVGTGRGWIYRSDDGKIWEKVAALKGDVDAIFEHYTRFLIAFNGHLYAGFELGALYRSADGLNWSRTNLEVGDNNGLRGAAIFNGALYVGTTGGGTIWKTADGETWQRVFESTQDTPGYVASMTVAGKYLFASSGGYVFRTADGLAWEEVGNLGPSSLEAMSSWRGSVYVGTSNAPAGFIYQANPAQKLPAHSH